MWGAWKMYPSEIFFSPNEWQKLKITTKNWGQPARQTNMRTACVAYNEDKSNRGMHNYFGMHAYKRNINSNIVWKLISAYVAPAARRVLNLQNRWMLDLLMEKPKSNVNNAIIWKMKTACKPTNNNNNNGGAKPGLSACAVVSAWKRK